MDGGTEEVILFVKEGSQSHQALPLLAVEFDNVGVALRVLGIADFDTPFFELNQDGVNRFEFSDKLLLGRVTMPSAGLLGVVVQVVAVLVIM